MKRIKECLKACVESQMSNLESVDTHELGEVIDMLKDLSEICYYDSITKAMEKTKETRYYNDNRNWDYQPVEMRDYREGRSPATRKMYMEHKELHKDKAVKMKELERYMHELTDDIMEMIDDATPEEKQILHTKLTALSNKIV